VKPIHLHTKLQSTALIEHTFRVKTSNTTVICTVWKIEILLYCLLTKQLVMHSIKYIYILAGPYHQPLLQCIKEF